MASHSAGNHRSYGDEGVFARIRSWFESLGLGRPKSHAARASIPAGDLSRANYEMGGENPYDSPQQEDLRRKKPLIVAGVVVVLVLTAAIRLVLLRHNVSSAVEQAHVVVAAAESGDAQALREGTTKIQRSVGAINRQLHSLPWNFLGIMPVVGRDVRGVQDIMAAVAEFCDDALPQVADLADELDVSNLFADGAINTDAVVGLQQLLRGITPSLRKASDDVNAVPTARINRLDELEGEAKDMLTKVADIAEVASEVDLPHLFGSDGSPRHYLVVAQTNAELRAAGGFPGAWVILTVDNGRIEMGEALTIQHYQTDIGWEEDELRVFYQVGVMDTSAVNFTPNFPVVGSRMAHIFENWVNIEAPKIAEQQAYEDYYYGLTETIEVEESEEITVSGVVAVDPVFLQRLLGLTNGVTVSKQKVTGDNAAEMLMHTAYEKYSARRQDRFFSSVAGKTFKKVMGNLDKINKRKLLKVLVDSAKDHRLQAWMREESEEQLMVALGLSGAIGQDETRPELGVYVNDNTWAKIDWYLDLNTEVGKRTYNADGTATYHVVTTFTNTGTYEELSEAKRYISGINPAKDREDDMILYPTLFAPAGGSISNVTVSKGNDFMEFELYGLDVWTGVIHPHAEQTITVAYDVTVSSNAQTELTVRSTPTAQSFD